MKAGKSRFKRFSFGFLLIPLIAVSQEYGQVKQYFDAYLNYHNGLDACVQITPDAIIFSGTENGRRKNEFVLSRNNWTKFASLVKTLPADSLEAIYTGKILLEKIAATPQIAKEGSLKGARIMIDPGHIAGTMRMARTEQKYLHFSKEIYSDLKADSVDVAEGILTYQTAFILKNMLEEKGAIAAFTRKENSTSFGCTYNEWLKHYRKRTLDSLVGAGRLTKEKASWLGRLSAQKFFLEFFKDYELQQRARVVNAFTPDLTVIIHYNVDEKNVPWLKPSDKNFCMAFIPGCIIADNLQTMAGKINLLRLLLTTDLSESEKASALLVNELSKQLSIPIAKSQDASYLDEHCLPASSPGVFCRNLALCRLVKSPLVYGECLYQDCITECYELTKNTETVYGIQTNKRVRLAAQAFFNALARYYSK